jgi:hypothetical protein
MQPREHDAIGWFGAAQVEELKFADPQWQVATVLKYPLTQFPVSGQLSVRDFRLAMRMHRTVRYLTPVFTPPG